MEVDARKTRRFLRSFAFGSIGTPVAIKDSPFSVDYHEDTRKKTAELEPSPATQRVDAVTNALIERSFKEESVSDNESDLEVVDEAMQRLASSTHPKHELAKKAIRTTVKSHSIGRATDGLLRVVRRDLKRTKTGHPQTKSA